MSQPLRFGVAYDFRNPAGSGLSQAELYARVLGQAELVDRLGYDLIWITEHHFVEDGYVPSFVAVAGALAARTERVRISSDIVLLPFQHPLRFAEDLAVLDNLSGGRIELGIGMGYAPHEFRAFGVSRRERVSRTREGIEVLRRAWRGDRFDFKGVHWTFEDALVRPRPVQPGGPPMWLAAMSEPSARRAARLGLHLLPQGDRRRVLDPWREELVGSGRRPEDFRVGIIRPWLVTDDRARDWPAVREAERYKARIYADWLRESGDAVTMLVPGQEARPIPQTWVVGDADTCYSELRAFITEYGLTDVVTWGAVPGLAPEAMSRSLERFASDVMPRLRTLGASGGEG